jgi:hypothetical protein
MASSLETATLQFGFASLSPYLFAWWGNNTISARFTWSQQLPHPRRDMWLQSEGAPSRGPLCSPQLDSGKEKSISSKRASTVGYGLFAGNRFVAAAASPRGSRGEAPTSDVAGPRRRPHSNTTPPAKTNTRK